MDVVYERLLALEGYNADPRLMPNGPRDLHGERRRQITLGNGVVPADGEVAENDQSGQWQQEYEER